MIHALLLTTPVLAPTALPVEYEYTAGTILLYVYLYETQETYSMLFTLTIWSDILALVLNKKHTKV